MNMNLKEMIAAGTVQRIYIQVITYNAARTIWAQTETAAWAVGHYENSRQAWDALREAKWTGGACAA